MRKANAIQIIVSATLLAFSLFSLVSTLISGDLTKPTHFTGVGNDNGRPILNSCREAYTVMCPTYHGD